MENRMRSPDRVSTMSSTFQHSIRGSILQNMTNNFHRSFISTSKSKNSPRSGSTSKSKIKVLPNYEKYSMENNLPFVTVFQTIEIERLSDEIETQRVRIKEYERQMFNGANYQVQIKELIDKCGAYEQEMGEYREELQKMNKICETLYHEHEVLKSKSKNTDSNMKSKYEEEVRKCKQLLNEAEKWQSKYHKSESNKEKQLEEVKELMEKQRKSMLQREMKDLEIRHQRECMNLNMQIKRLNELLSLKQKEHEDMKAQCKNSLNQIHELKQKGSKLSQYEQKVTLLSQEHARLSKLIDLNQIQLQQARRRQFQLNEKLQAGQELAFDIQHLREYLQIKEKQLSDCHSIITELEKENSGNKQIRICYQELQCRLENSQFQVQRLNKMAKQRGNEIEKYKGLRKQLQTTNQHLKEAEELAVELQGKNNSLKTENQRLNGLIKSKQNELSDWKNKYSSMNSEQQGLTKLDRQKKNIEQKYKTQVERNRQLRSYIEQIESEMKESRISNSRQLQLQRSKEILHMQNERLKSKMLNYEAELKQLKENESELSRQNMKIRESDNAAMKYENQIALLSHQISRLTELLKQKNEEIVKLEDEKIASLSKNYRHLEGELEDKEKSYDLIKAQLHQFQWKVSEYRNKLEQVEESNRNFIQQIQQRESTVKEQLRVKTREFDEMKSNYDKMRRDLVEINQLQKLCQKQQNRITVYLHDLEDLKASNRSFQRDLEAQKFRNKQLLKQLSRFKQNGGNFTFPSQVPESTKSAPSPNVDSEKIIMKIGQVEGQIEELKEKYSSLLRQVNEQDITIRNGNSFIEDE